MTTLANPSEPAVAAGRGRPSSRENFVTLLGGLWLTVGLFIDGYAHANIIDTQTEDFFTPWHAIFYSGFAFSAGWIAWMMYRRQGATGLRSWIPDGYGWAVVGIGVFAIGGMGDAIWHTVFGVEVGIDALLSPTHLVLLFGLIMILAAPMRASFRTGGSIWLAVASLTMLALLAAFFTTFIRPLGRAGVLEIPFDPRFDDDQWVTWMVGGVMITTAIMCLTALYLLQRCKNLPFGAITALWAVPAWLEAVALSRTATVALIGGLIGGIVADGLLHSLGGSNGFRFGVALSIGSVATWTAWTAAHHLLSGPIAIPAEIWAGQIVLSAVIAAGLTLLAVGPSHPVRSG